MVLGQDGLLTPSSTPHDKCVVGVVSGAGDYKPGIILDRQPMGNRRPIALVGKAFCKVTARGGRIAVGDLLATSDLVGHAMKAGYASQAFGAIIGKALAPHEAGEGMIPMLISLQ